MTSWPKGRAARATSPLYYELAPLILARLPHATRNARLRSLYARYILPSALAARLGLDTLAYRLYAG